ncbi:hypothetical protein FRC03_012560 [Tulasnella sp. 419]|nr:hypothetical protein FRC02_004628 [Tulasnella sp. 418]KAG8966076.1 hypothetical protein FRC03_012560 [Tulasnella sp. 419]
MDDLPPLTSGSVSSRFVSQGEIDAANANRDAAWKAAYARLGQEPPPKPVEDYDGRSLYDRLQEQKTKKQDEWDQKMKLGNQFRGIDEEETAFLASVQDQKLREEHSRKLQDAEEVRLFKEATMNKAESVATSTKTPSNTTAKPQAPKPSVGKKKDQKALLKAIVRKKDKGKSSSSSNQSTSSTKKATEESKNSTTENGSPDKKDEPQDNSTTGKRSAPSLDDDNNLESKKPKLYD